MTPQRLGTRIAARNVGQFTANGHGFARLTRQAHQVAVNIENEHRLYNPQRSTNTTHAWDATRRTPDNGGTLFKTTTQCCTSRHIFGCWR
jgi:hypothetical protein